MASTGSGFRVAGAMTTGRNISRRRFLWKMSKLGGTGAAATGLYTWFWEPHWVEFVERDLPLANLPEDLRGKRLVQLTDLHIGPRVDDGFLIETFEQVNRLKAEFVVYTGDLTSYEGDIMAHAGRMFRHLPLGSRGTFGLLGNHDYGPNWEHPEIANQLARLAEERGVKILRNEVAEVDGLQIAGLDDLWAGRFDLRRGLGDLSSKGAALVLSHNPDTADEPGWDDYAGWILCGHTHGGQCKAPFLPPPLLPVRNRRYTAGEFALDGGRRMYISRGVGHLLKVRFNARPEVTVFRLTRA